MRDDADSSGAFVEGGLKFLESGNIRMTGYNLDVPGFRVPDFSRDSQRVCHLFDVGSESDALHFALYANFPLWHE